jgi:hypothetical protein
MAEKPPSFTVSDRRKFTLDGELRDENAATEKASSFPELPMEQAKSKDATDPHPAATSAQAIETPEQEDEEELLVEPTAQESDEQHAAYKRSSDELDALLRQANPGLGASAPVTMEHIIQSMYLSAVVAMGAATEPGQKPRIDIVGARQSVDMLGVLQEKTKGNLSEKEQRLLQSALFELRMMFLDITNAIAKQAQKPPAGAK